ncbi:helix-hairpin-helix domain-containing protein [Vreelandella sp. F11]|uniref:helix-hairpin-helix domain-containing protein n=1 Tax=Vreelandella sp. F11 TaxID=3394751 RepID=UPI0036DC597B
MTAEPSQTTDLPAEQLRDNINTLMHTVTALLEGELTQGVLETALKSHDDLRDQLAAQPLGTSTLSALQRIEQFIASQAGHYYQTASVDFDEQQEGRFITLFARQLLTLDGIGPATARQLFQIGIFTPEHFFALTPKEVAQLNLPAATLARLIPLHAQAPPLARFSETT